MLDVDLLVIEARGQLVGALEGLLGLLGVAVDIHESSGLGAVPSPLTPLPRGEGKHRILSQREKGNIGLQVACPARHARTAGTQSDSALGLATLGVSEMDARRAEKTQLCD